MPAGRPRKVRAGALYALADLLYRDFVRLAEGYERNILDKKKGEKLHDKAKRLQLNGVARRRHKIMVEDEIRAGRLEGDNRKERLRDIRAAELWAQRKNSSIVADQEATKKIRVPNDRDVLERLLNPSTTPAMIREISKEALMERRVEPEPGVFVTVEGWAWPVSIGSMLHQYLSKYAEEFVAARNDPRFPKSARPTNLRKRFWFLSRALAGAAFGVTARTSINLVGSKRPERMFEESRAAKAVRKSTKRRKTL